MAMNDNNTAKSKWASRFIFAALVQGALALGLTAYLLYQAVFGVPAASRIVAGGGAGTWLTVGYFGYLLFGVLGTVAMALVYWHLEATLRKPYGRKAGILAWLHLVLWNVGVLGATWLMMHAGYRGGAAALPEAVGGLGWNAGQIHTLILAAYPPYIAAFLAVAVAGAFLGLLGYAITWARATAEAKMPVAAAQT